MPVAPVVLDSHALVAYFRDEPGAEIVEALLTRAAASERPLHMTEVNYAEAKGPCKNNFRFWRERHRAKCEARGRRIPPMGL